MLGNIASKFLADHVILLCFFFLFAFPLYRFFFPNADLLFHSVREVIRAYTCHKLIPLQALMFKHGFDTRIYILLFAGLVCVISAFSRKKKKTCILRLNMCQFHLNDGTKVFNQNFHLMYTLTYLSICDRA